MQAIYDALKDFVKTDQMLQNEPMSRHTTFRVGGPADLMFFPEDEEQIARALGIASQMGVPTFVMGNGSNLIVRDGGIRGMVIVLGERFAQIHIDGTILAAQAGATMARAASAAQAASLSGLEFISGIPGTLGGGCAMNAGAYGGQLSDVLLDAHVLMNGEIRILTNKEMEMRYRSTKPLRQGGIVLSMRFELTPGDPAQISSRMRELNARRRQKQPLNFPSAGSVFKRPEGFFAGALIEQAGLKGVSIGGAQVSPKHAGFIVNTGGATAQDVLKLIARVQHDVLENSGIDLETEVRVIGE